MVLEPLCCPHCHTTEVINNGKRSEGQQRYRGRNAECARTSFMPDDPYRGHIPAVKQQVSEMAMNGNGSRDTARVLHMSPTTVIEELKKHRHLEPVNRRALDHHPGLPPAIMIVPVEAEMDEMWSFVQSKRQQRWLWHAMDHHSGEVLA
jgi:insertion element IS1 protein InsB